MAELALIEAEELPGQTMLHLERDGHDRWWLPLARPMENESSTGTMSVVPCSLNEQSADVDVAGFGDGSPVFSVAGRALRGYQSRIIHEPTQRGESVVLPSLKNIP